MEPADDCPAYVLISPGRRARCTGRLGHVLPGDVVVHVGSVRVELPSGKEQAAMVLWTEDESALPDSNLLHAD